MRRMSTICCLTLMFVMCIWSCTPQPRQEQEHVQESSKPKQEQSSETVVADERIQRDELLSKDGSVEPTPEIQPEPVPEKVVEKPQDQPANHCKQNLTWSKGTNFPYPRDHHHTLIATASGKPYLYVIGGNTYISDFRDIWRSPIKEDGSIGEWTKIGYYPFSVHGGGLVQFTMGEGASAKKHVMIVSGTMSRAVWSATINSDGTFSKWVSHRTVPDGRYHLTAEYYKGYIFAIGGIRRGGHATDTIFRGKLDKDGKITAWDTLKLPEARSHHSSYIKDGYLYLVSGFAGNSANSKTVPHKNIIRAKLGDDGSVGTWETVGTFEWELSTQSNVSFDNCLFVFGGITVGEPFTTYHNSILRGSYDGKKYSKLVRMPDKLVKGISHSHHAPYYKGRIYLVGGSEGYRKLTGFVQIGTFKNE